MKKLFIQLKTVSGKKSTINNVKLLDFKRVLGNKLVSFMGPVSWYLDIYQVYKLCIITNPNQHDWW
jgi:hypothetical protein